jgi:hypothetical protein
VAFVDLPKNKLVLKVALVGPPAVGKTSRLEQLARHGGQRHDFGSRMMAATSMAVLPLASVASPRPVEVEVYEWHGPEKVDLRGKALWTGLDGLIYVPDARENRWVDSIATFKFLLDEAGKSRIVRVPSLLVLGRMDDGLLRLKRYEAELQGPTWTERVEASLEPAEPFVEGVRMLGEAMLARML